MSRPATVFPITPAALTAALAGYLPLTGGTLSDALLLKKAWGSNSQTIHAQDGSGNELFEHVTYSSSNNLLNLGGNTALQGFGSLLRVGAGFSDIVPQCDIDMNGHSILNQIKLAVKGLLTNSYEVVASITDSSFNDLFSFLDNNTTNATFNMIGSSALQAFNTSLRLGYGFASLDSYNAVLNMRGNAINGNAGGGTGGTTWNLDNGSITGVNALVMNGFINPVSYAVSSLPTGFVNGGSIAYATDASYGGQIGALVTWNSNANAWLTGDNAAVHT